MYLSVRYAEDEPVKGLARETIKKRGGTVIRMGTYIPEFL